MSHFYGYLTGHRGTATRCGTKNSGITARIKSWTHNVVAELKEYINGEDHLILTIPKGLRVTIVTDADTNTWEGLK